MHEGDKVREFYSELPRPVLVSIEATGATQWFLKLMEDRTFQFLPLLGIPYLMLVSSMVKWSHEQGSKNYGRGARKAVGAGPGSQWRGYYANCAHGIAACRGLANLCAIAGIAGES